VKLGTEVVQIFTAIVCHQENPKFDLSRRIIIDGTGIKYESSALRIIVDEDGEMYGDINAESGKAVYARSLPDLIEKLDEQWFCYEWDGQEKRAVSDFILGREQLAQLIKMELKRMRRR